MWTRDVDTLCRLILGGLRLLTAARLLSLCRGEEFRSASCAMHRKRVRSAVAKPCCRACCALSQAQFFEAKLKTYVENCYETFIAGLFGWPVVWGSGLHLFLEAGTPGPSQMRENPSTSSSSSSTAAPFPAPLAPAKQRNEEGAGSG
jgi:hypothetical protein